MRKMLSLSMFLLLPLLTTAAAGVAPQKVFRVSDGNIVSFNEMIDDLKKVSVVFVGEVHDIPEHHVAQLNIIKAVHAEERPVAVGLEMFRAENQPSLNSWVHGKLPIEKFLLVYYDNWAMPWPLYRDIFLYARDNQLPLRGLNIPDGISKKIARSGFASLTADEKKQLPPGISCNVDPTYMEFIRRAYAGHGKMHEKNFVNFCEAQMVWDKAMAWHLMGYLKKNPDRTMLVLAGIGHAWKRGISEQLEPGAKLTYRVVLPAVPDQIDRESVTIKDADYVLLN